MTTTTAPAKLSASDRRMAHLNGLLADYNAEVRSYALQGKMFSPVMGLDYWKAQAAELAEGGKLGRTDRWKEAVLFAVRHHEEAGDELTEELARWAVIQGIIFASHSA